VSRRRRRRRRKVLFKANAVNQEEEEEEGKGDEATARVPGITPRARVHGTECW